MHIILIDAINRRDERKPHNVNRYRWSIMDGLRFSSIVATSRLSYVDEASAIADAKESLQFVKG